MKIKVLVCIFLSLILCGCSYVEPSSRYTVSAVGFDITQGKTCIIIQMINVDGGENADTFTAQGSGSTPKAALDDVKTVLSKKPSFSHCQLIAISDSVKEEDLKSYIDLLRGLEISLKTSIVYCKDVKNLLANKNLPSGTELSALLKQNSKEFGFGGHTAVFEIATALSLPKGDFALPVLDAKKDRVAVDGLMRYSKGAPAEHLGIKESINYAKEKNVYEGDRQ